MGEPIKTIVTLVGGPRAGLVLSTINTPGSTLHMPRLGSDGWLLDVYRHSTPTEMVWDQDESARYTKGIITSMRLTIDG